MSQSSPPTPSERSWIDAAAFHGTKPKHMSKNLRPSVQLQEQGRKASAWWQQVAIMRSLRKHTSFTAVPWTNAGQSRMTTCSEERWHPGTMHHENLQYINKRSADSLVVIHNLMVPCGTLCVRVSYYSSPGCQGSRLEWRGSPCHWLVEPSSADFHIQQVNGSMGLGCAQQHAGSHLFASVMPG